MPWSALIGREIDGKKIVNILVETVLAVGFVVFMLVGTFVFIKFIALSQLPFAITALITNLSAPSAIIIIAIGIMYVVLGMLMPQIPMMILTVPLLYPSILALGFDPIWFGVFVVLMMALGVSHPLAWMPLLFPDCPVCRLRPSTKAYGPSS